MFERKITGHLVAAVPVAGIVIGIHRYTTHVYAQFTVRGKHAPHHRRLRAVGQHRDGIVASLVEAGAPTAKFKTVGKRFYYRPFGFVRQTYYGSRLP